MYPTLGQVIIFKEYNCEDILKGKVFRVYKKNSKYKNIKQLELYDGSKVEKDFENEIEFWEPVSVAEIQDGDVDSLTLGDEVDTAYPVKLVPKREYKSVEVQNAMRVEIEKFKAFDAYEEVEDKGQNSIPIRWVVSRKPNDGKDQPVKARLCMRGDLEQGKGSIRADSPTAGKDTLKLAMLVAANEGFAIKSIDIKSAYLQGCDLQRDIFVRPPPEANSNKLWRLKKAAYGIMDGGRLFYIRLQEELKKLGLHEVHSDGALFTYVVNGKLHGLIASHVDDLLLAGDDLFKREVEDKLTQHFKISKMEENVFNYCGCRIQRYDDGKIVLDQHDYTEAIEEISSVEGELEQKLSPQEQRLLRGKIGEILWISLLTRPDLAFEVNKLASDVPTATMKSIRDVNNLIRRAKNKKNVITFSKLGPLCDLVVKLYTDASFNNRDGQIRSTEGRVILVENSGSGKTAVLSWKTKKIPRICRSVKAAETRSLDDGLDDAIHIARILKEVYTGSIDLKAPEQLPVVAMIDSKSLWENLYNTRQCEEKLLRNTIAGIKESMEVGLVSAIEWVSTDNQLADCLTKKGTVLKSDWLLEVAETNRIERALGRIY